MSSLPTPPTIDFISLLELGGFSAQQQELGLREFRIRGIDVIIDELKKKLEKEDKTALNNHLKMCPQIDTLTTHLQSEYKEFKGVLADYLPKLHKKLA